jgi:hypothetical protein
MPKSQRYETKLRQVACLTKQDMKDVNYKEATAGKKRKDFYPK